MSTGSFVSGLAYLVAAVLFVVGLHQMRTPSTARRGNLLSACGMAVAVSATAAVAVIGAVTDGSSLWAWTVLLIGLVAGSAFGLSRARLTKMTDVPQLVSILNAVGGGAAATIGLAEFVRYAGATVPLDATSTVPIVLDVFIGAVTFAGSLVAAGKLQGLVPGRPLTFPGARALNVALVAVAAACAVMVVVAPQRPLFILVLLASSSTLGVLMVLPIGGADAPVIVSLLNAFTGLAVAFAGFAIGNQSLIIAGALVGAAGTILTLQMAAAMNRSVVSIILGGFGTGDATAAAAGTDVAQAAVRRVDADDVGLQLAYARHVMIVPGYGLAAAQAQHEVAELATVLASHGIDVTYAIHPVAGRMPGHMNVLLAEANVPYTQMLQLDQANAAFDSCDVALVIGANDVTNPAGRRAGNALSGMPILDVDHAKSVVVIKRSMRPGYSGIPNELFSDPRTGMFFADAKQGLADILLAVKQYAASV